MIGVSDPRRIVRYSYTAVSGRMDPYLNVPVKLRIMQDAACMRVCGGKGSKYGKYSEDLSGQYSETVRAKRSRRNRRETLVYESILSKDLA